MKVLALIFVAIVLADGKGSGPYLPSGWRPDGPAFFLPSEIVKPSPKPVIDLNLQGSEASGSDFLREYGPPKVQEISQNLLNQGLPDETTEQTFGVSAQNAGSSLVATEKVEGVSEVKPEAVSTELPTTAPQSSIDYNPPISAELPILGFVVRETTTIPNVEQATEIISQTNQQESKVELNQQNSQEAISAQLNQQNSQESATVSTNQQESTQSVVSQQEPSTASDLEQATASVDSVGNTEVLLVNVPSIYDQNVPELQNIPDIIAGLEKEILTEQKLIHASGDPRAGAYLAQRLSLAIQRGNSASILGTMPIKDQLDGAEVKQAEVSETASGQSLGQVPEGFLEYGPPGFAEYGPPKEDQQKSENLQTIKTNETRRRRFSPRIRFGKH